MLSNNLFYLASAGAGKTTLICKYAVDNPNLRILLTTYTTENTSLLKKSIYEMNGVLPHNVTVVSWFSFLLSECVRPYQNFKHGSTRIENIYFSSSVSSKFIKRDNASQFYLSDNRYIYSDKMSDFAYHCNEMSNGLVVKRLEQRFDVFILDEAQDISGWDLEFVNLLLNSRIKVIMVADPRQRTYSTSQSPKNKKYSRDVSLWFEELHKKELGELILLNQSYRCIQKICDFADDIFPSFPRTKSLNCNESLHNGIYVLKPNDLLRYHELIGPKILVYSKKQSEAALGLPVRNFGEVKGRTYDHVVIIPTKNIEKFLNHRNTKEIEKVKQKFYVAVTRARYSVAFLISDEKSYESATTQLPRWKCPHAK